MLPWMPKRGAASVSDIAVMLASKCVTCGVERGEWCVVKHSENAGDFTVELHIRRVRAMWRAKNTARRTVRRDETRTRRSYPSLAFVPPSSTWPTDG